MLTNYLKIAWRNLLRNKAFSAINIVGLALGMATCLLIGLFVLDELSYDRFHEKADRIVRVVLRGTLNGEQVREANVMPPVAYALQSRFPEINRTTRLRTAGKPPIAYGDKLFRTNQLAFADSTLFRVFTLPLVKGDARTALVSPNTIVVSESMARQFFGSENPIGKVVLVFGDKVAYTVTGVIADVPAHSHFRFDAFASMTGVAEANQDNWLQSGFFTYLLLPDGYDYRQLEDKLQPIIDANMLPPLEKMMGTTSAEFKKKGGQLGLFLQPLTDIHLHSDLKPETELEPGGDIRYVYLFGAIAVFMLLLACINFINLSTASSTKRAKEVGIRKALGSERATLIGQFLIESSLLTTLSLVLAVGLVIVLLPAFNRLSGKALSLTSINGYGLLPGLLGFGLVVSILAGSYPAFSLSSFRPIATLKGAVVTPGNWRIGLRGGLVVFQFFVSISLLIGTTVVYRQLHYIQTMKLGYDKEQVLVLERTGVLGQNEAVWRQKLAQDARVVHASVSGFLPNNKLNTGIIAMHPTRESARLTRLSLFGIDQHYVPTLGMKVVAGRNFSATFPSDSSAVLINEATARLFNWRGDAVGQTLVSPALPGSGNPDKTFRVIGVVQDFHFRSLHEPVAPAVMLLGNNSGGILLKTRTSNVANLLAALKDQWSAFKTDAPFTYSFLDESYQATYQAELKTGQILSLFAGLTIFIACLGLFGLATFTAEQRTKEIGVRKVLGASVTSIVALLSKDFLKLVLIAIVIASPLAWYAMTWWLQDFAYRINIEWWVFVLAGALAVGIALLTVSFQSIKAALMNPVKSLRSE
ncbi:ABC transporter permease [Fibrella aquatilis]|uniref:ABC transporter permease n=1 Tax=Fibrella aquatilis TaxID=2817059 RepID=A0A939G2T0_9BACT|nr:ABC transporter permease [Fibrella aquatilis]MBO0930841.1 ABC transporter permease [Fibrella aquatilis]